jgi:fructose-bisphosphate aldolase class II
MRFVNRFLTAIVRNRITIPNRFSKPRNICIDKEKAMLVTLNDILPKARKKGYAVGAFNTSNLEITQAIITAAQTLNAPVILATSEKAIKYAGIENISEMIIGMSKRATIPVVLHLDHGSSYELCLECIKHGYTSVMIDASQLSFNDNVGLTRKVVHYARKYGVAVEAEIGRLAGIEDDLKVKKAEVFYTDPDEALRFARQSRCDALAIAIGTSHGAYKFKGTPKLRIDILAEIAQKVNIPLVLHGASGVKIKWINRVNEYGGALEHARGVPDRLIRNAVKNGIAKINTDTDLRIGFTAGMREYLVKNPKVFDPRKITAAARDRIVEIVIDRIRVFGADNRA